MKLLLQKDTSWVSGEHNRVLTGPACEAGAPPVPKRWPARIWVELMLGLMSAVSLTLAILLPHWMELLFRLAPDGGDGSAEMGFALWWATISVLMFGLAGHTWRKQVRLLRSA